MREVSRRVFLGAVVALAEAPGVRAQVAGGKLPALADRLPVNPKVVPVNGSIGRYGGTWRSSMSGASDVFSLVRTMGYENLTRWKPWSPDRKQTDILPDVDMNVAESVDVADDGRLYTFHLRRGMRWSDGHPFTADDIVFWHRDVFLNTELFPARPPWLVRGGEPVSVEKIDDATVTFRFKEPQGLLLQWLATPANLREPNVPTGYPRHYLMQFHKTYVPDIAAVAATQRQPNWVALFHSMADKWSNPAVPVIDPWVVTTGVGQGDGARVRAQRNPYYWKVDPKGNQLPYIDGTTFDVIGDNQVLLLKALNGDFDMVDSYLGFVTTPENKAQFADAQEKGGYDFYEVLPDRANLMIVSLNLTHKDPVKRALFGNIDVRRALSIAINRPEIIDLVFLGQGLPYQVAERPESPLFDKTMATQYTQYDTKAANDLLDKAGLDKRNGDGTRLGPDGRPLRITIDISTLRQPWIDSAELIKRHWQLVGVELFINAVSTTLLNQRVMNNEHDAAVWSTSGGADTVFDPKYYFPTSWASFYAPAWGAWYSGGSGAEEPPPAAKQQMQLYDQLQGKLLTPAQRLEVMRQVLAIAAQQFWSIGIIQPTQDYGVINRRMRNVPPVMLASSEYPHPGPVNPEQFYFTG